MDRYAAISRMMEPDGYRVAMVQIFDEGSMAQQIVSPFAAVQATIQSGLAERWDTPLEVWVNDGIVVDPADALFLLEIAGAVGAPE
jgi:hypothetical protein